MPTVTGIDTLMSMDFAVLPKKDGKKQAEPFKAPEEAAQGDAKPQGAVTGTASPLDLMSMETFLALLDLGSPASSGPNTNP